MNKRKKQWDIELQQGISEYENRTGNEYDYYGRRSRKTKIKWKDSKGASYRISWIIRYILGISMIAYTITRYLGIDLISIIFKGR